MTFQKQILGLMAAGAGLALVSCDSVSGGGGFDSSYPTVAEQDRLDTQWGLPPRKSKGAPKRSFQYQAPDDGGGAPVAAAPPRAPISAPAEAAPVQQPPSDAIDPNVLNKLR